LYSEDDDMLREKSILIFQNIFKTVDACIDGKEALALYQKSIEESNPYDIVITDIMMLNMDGLDLSRAVLALNRNQKILINSAHNEKDKLEDIIDIGITNFLHKPLKLERLISVINRVSLEIEEEKQNTKTLETRDSYLGIQNLTTLHNHIQNHSNKTIVLISIRNLNTIHTIYGLDQVNKLTNIKNFVCKL
jgi:YesN/AraC family two-component response regulator